MPKLSRNERKWFQEWLDLDDDDAVCPYYRAHTGEKEPDYKYEFKKEICSRCFSWFDDLYGEPIFSCPCFFLGYDVVQEHVRKLLKERLPE